MVIFPHAPDQTIAKMWSSGARGGRRQITISLLFASHVREVIHSTTWCSGPWEIGLCWLYVLWC